MLTEAETKEIEKEALKAYPPKIVVGYPDEDDENFSNRSIWIAGATRMAEKKNYEAETRERLIQLQEEEIRNTKTELERVKAVNKELMDDLSGKNRDINYDLLNPENDGN